MSITSLTSNGLRDWLIQRISSLIIAVYVLFLFIFLVLHPQLDYVTWQNLYKSVAIKIATLATLIAVFLHGWIGVWTVLTDYVKSTFVRLSLQCFVILSLVGCVVWGWTILWSVQ